jgi:hypothetical protein
MRDVRWGKQRRETEMSEMSVVGGGRKGGRERENE